jgi:RimJ/RimL family protein N-acetyltransferase
MGYSEFYAFHAPALEADEARHYMLLGWMASCVNGVQPGFRAWNFEVPGVCAMQPAAEFAIVLGALGKAECRFLAERVMGSAFPGVMGPGDGPHWFAARAHELGLAWRRPLINSIHRLDGAPVPPDIPGEARAVTPGDLPLFAEWMNGYMREALPDEPPCDPRWLERWASDGSYRFWTVDDMPVSMAGAYWKTRNGAAITGVYTPPAERGKGYAAAATAAAARRMRDNGCAQVFLMARTDNAPALRCYARIGFRPVADFVHYWRGMPAA